MFRKISDHHYTASVSNGELTKMFDDGWGNLLDCRMTFASDAEAIAWLGSEWEEYDPNASLKAAGLVWNGYCYARPGA